MRPDIRPRLAAATAAALLCLLSGCATLEGVNAPQTANQPTAATEDRDTAVALMLASTIQTLQRLAGAGPAEQAEIVTSARSAYERAPLGPAQLRYALALGLPGHAARDPERARLLLRELAAQPESLAPVERALTLIELSQLDRELGLKNDNERLQAGNLRDDRERQTASSRRLAIEIEENVKLRRQLEEAQAKLDAIAKIERNITERQGTNEARKP